MPPQTIPATAGIGLRARHHAEIVSQRPTVAWFEAHAENYFGAGGLARSWLEKVREAYPLSLHGVGLSLGSVDSLDPRHLSALAALVRDLEPGLVSEHLSWSSVGGVFTNDLLPLPFTEEALQLLVTRVRELQDRLGRQILVENTSSYLTWTGGEMEEWEFLAALATEAQCGLLLDINNVYVNAMNHGFEAASFLEGIAPGTVGEIHLAGHSVNESGGRRLRIDTHGTRVCDAVWALFGAAIARFGPVPTLIEWDTDIPDLDVLLDEAARADRVLERFDAIAA